MQQLEQKYPDAVNMIRRARSQGLSEKAIEQAVVKAGYQRKARTDLNPISALVENISQPGLFSDIPVIGKPLNVAFEILDLPQDIATAALSGGDETFLEKFARGQDPSEALGIENTVGKLAADILLDPLALIGAPAKVPLKAALRARKVLRAERAIVAAEEAKKATDTARPIGKILGNIRPAKDTEEALQRLTIESGGYISKEAAEKIVQGADDLEEALKQSIKANVFDIARHRNVPKDQLKDVYELTLREAAELAEGITGKKINYNKLGIKPETTVMDKIPDPIDYPDPAEVASRAPDRLFDIDDFSKAIPHLNKKTLNEIGNAFIKLAKEKKIEVQPTSAQRLYIQILGAINSGKIDLKEIARAAGKTDAEAIDAVRSMITATEGVSDAARAMNEYKQLADKARQFVKKMQEADIDPDLKKLLDELEAATNKIEPEGIFKKWYKLIVNKLWRGSLTTQSSTMMRNAIVQAGRVGLDVMQKSIDAMIQTIPGIQRKVAPEDVFSTVMQLFRKNKKLTEDLLANNPKILDELWSNFVSDIEFGKFGSKAQKFADDYTRILNAGNIFQEKIFRNAIFQAELKSALRATGKNLDEIIANNAIREIPRDILEQSTKKALEMTFAKAPDSKIAQKFIRAVNDIPGLSLAFPFPRFLMNSMKFFFDFSPFGALRLYSPQQLAKIAKGDTAVISRAILGSAMLGAAFEIQNSKWAGDKWYEIKMDDGTKYDMRPFNPFVAYMFVADVVKRANEGRLHELKAGDIAQGILSSNIRAGTGLFLVDNLLDSMRGEGSADKIIDKIKSFAGEFTSGFFTPLGTLMDVYKEYVPEARVVRERRAEPFLGPIKARIPGLAETLPPIELATREEPFVQEKPLQRLLGFSARQPSNDLEKELARLDFSFREISPTTGEREADVLIRKHMGRLAERSLIPLVQSSGYKNLSDTQKALVLSRAIKRTRANARELARAENPAIFEKLRKRRIPRRERRALKELGQF